MFSTTVSSSSRGVFLRHHAEPLFNPAAVGGRIEAEDFQRAARALDHAVETADEGGFSRAVRAEQPDAFAPA